MFDYFYGSWKIPAVIRKNSGLDMRENTAVCCVVYSNHVLDICCITGEIIFLILLVCVYIEMSYLHDIFQELLPVG